MHWIYSEVWSSAKPLLLFLARKQNVFFPLTGGNPTRSIVNIYHIEY